MFMPVVFGGLLAGCSPRGAAVCGRAEAPGAGLLCVSPAEAWSNRGVNQGVQGRLLPRPCITMGWDWARSSYTMGKYKKTTKVLLGNECLHPPGCCCRPGLRLERHCRSCLREVGAGLPWDSQPGGGGCKNSTDLVSEL